MRYDLIIVGGGLIGTGLAIALRESNLKIALIDARIPSANDPRLFALTHSSCQFLKNLGLWPFLSAHAEAIREVHVSQQKRFGTVRLRSQEVNLDALGYVIPAHQIESVLNKALEETTIDFYRPATLQSLTHEEDQALVTISTEEGEKQLYSPVIIGADGTNSTVRTQTNISTQVIDYKQSAMVTKTTLSQSHQNIAYERFLSQGAIAMLPLLGNECGTIWSAPSEDIAYLQTLTDQEFLQTLQKEFGYRLGRFKSISARHVFPLRMVAAEKNVEKNVFLLGNAAHTLHPIAAQGFNLGLYEVAALAESILDKTKSHQSLFQHDLVQIYQQMQSQQANSMALSHRLSQLFGSQSSLVGLGLQCGMVALDIATPLKQKFIKKVIGMSGRVPQLLLSA